MYGHWGRDFKYWSQRITKLGDLNSVSGYSNSWIADLRCGFSKTYESSVSSIGKKKSSLP